MTDSEICLLLLLLGNEEAHITGITLIKAYRTGSSQRRVTHVMTSTSCARHADESIASAYCIGNGWGYHGTAGHLEKERREIYLH